jgi:hypothetical protein
MRRTTSRKRRQTKRLNPYKPRDYDTNLGLTEPTGFMGRLNEMPVSVGAQIFSIVPSVSGALALFLLSFKLARATKISVSEVVAASAISAVGALAGFFIVRTYH